MFLLEVENLYFSFDGRQKVLEDVSFKVSRGEFVGILGPNGSGKTTLLKVILGFLRPLKGKVRLFGKELETFRDWDRIGYVPQKVQVEPLFPATVRELLSSLGEIREEVIDVLHIEDLMNKQFTKLSGGQQQRVLLAMALMNDPQLIILDEPTTGLDPHARDHILRLLRDLVTNELKSVIMVSHDLSLVMKMVDRVLCLNRRLIYFGDVEGSFEAIREIFGIPIRDR